MPILLVRPDSRKKNYQSLSNLSAIEPPYFLSLRATELYCEGKDFVVADEEVGDEIPDLDYESVEIYPSGSHPSSFIPQMEGVEKIVRKYGGKAKVVDYFPVKNYDTTSYITIFDVSKYRAHNWHCWGGHKRSPYWVVASSFGCPFSCQFCCVKSFYKCYHERPIPLVFDDINQAETMGVKNIKFLDELFFYNKKRVKELCQMVSGRDLNMWAYARIDTIDYKLLPLIRKAGFRWLGIGIESGSEEIRKKSLKGRFSNKKIKEVIRAVQDNGIGVGGNFLFGFLDDTYLTMQKTLDFAVELNCEFANFNPVMAFPGSDLYTFAKKNNWGLPSTWSGYSYYSYDCRPLGTITLTARDVLLFRDNAFQAYYNNKHYLGSIKKKFGQEAVDDIKTMTSIPMRRKLIEDFYTG